MTVPRRNWAQAGPPTHLPSAASGSTRFASLDGLRGLAALTVVIHHALLTSEAEALRWAGPAAVIVFFVLSGFVLPLPFLREAPSSWRSYYPARLLRLYVPVWGAVALSTLLIVAVPRETAPGLSPWVAAHDVPLDLGTVLGDLTLTSPSWNTSPLWSLQYEVAFSLLLPLYLWVAARLKAPTVAAAAGCGLLLVCLAGALLGNSWLTFMPMFAMGVLMSVQRERLLNLAVRTPSWAWAVAGVVAFALMTASWLPYPISSTPGVLVGAALTVLIFLGCPAAVRVGHLRFVRLLGTLSFSLYLVHEPIIVTLAHLWPTLSVATSLVVGVAVSLGLAWAFYRVVELPAHLLSKRLAKYVLSR